MQLSPGDYELLASHEREKNTAAKVGGGRRWEP